MILLIALIFIVPIVLSIINALGCAVNDWAPIVEQMNKDKKL